MKVPSGTQSVQLHPYRLKPVLSEQADAILDPYIAVGLIQPFTSPWSSPLIYVPNKFGCIRITTKLKKVTEITRITTPRAEEALDALGGGSVLLVFVLFAGFTQLTIHPYTILLTDFCTPHGLYEWLRMPQGTVGAPPVSSALCYSL